MRHGRATMPFGKYKGVRIRLIPDDYLSWLTGAAMIDEPKWKWLLDSLIAELRFRGLRSDLALSPDPATDPPSREPRPIRKFRREASL